MTSSQKSRTIIIEIIDMHSLLKRLIFVLFLIFFIFSPKLSFSDWGSDTTPPTIKITVTCSDGSVITSDGGKTTASCDTTTAEIKIEYCKQANCSDTGNGLQTITHSITNDSGTGTTTYGPDGDSSSQYCRTPTPTPTPTTPPTITLSCDQIPPTRKITYTKDATSSTSTYNISASALDYSGNQTTIDSSAPFTIFFIKYSIQGAVYVDTDKDGTKDIGENPYTGGNSTIQVRVASSTLCSGALVTSVGTNGTITTSNGTYDTGQNLLVGSYDICYTNKPSDYLITLPQGAPPSRTVTVGPSATNINFGITNSTAWFQGVDGDMRLDGAFTDKLPSGKKASENGSGGTPGIILTNGSTDFGSGTASEKQWKVNNSTNPQLTQPSFIRTSYSYLSSLANQSGSTDITTVPNCSLSSCSLSSANNGIYKANGNLTLNATTFQSGKNFVILVAGELIINGNIIVPNGSTAVFSASGDIKVNSTVGETSPSSATVNIEGFFSTDKNFILDGTNNCLQATDKRLNVSGAIVANASLSGGYFQNKRDLCGGNNGNPSLYIVQRVDFILNAPAFIRRTSSIWREVPPAE